MEKYIMPPNQYSTKRIMLVQHLQDSGAIKNESVKNAFLNVKRELFVAENMQAHAYADDALPIGHNQTISQPTTIAIMLELLDVKEGMKVLEVGAGCGYVVALLSQLVGEKGKVNGIEIVPELLERSKKNLEKIGAVNVTLISGDGSKGWDNEQEFDRILLSASCPFVPKPLLDQLREKGKIVAPVGDPYTQQLITIMKKGNQILKQEYPYGYFAFVPLKGKHGWK